MVGEHRGEVVGGQDELVLEVDFKFAKIGRLRADNLETGQKHGVVVDLILTGIDDKEGR